MWREVDAAKSLTQRQVDELRNEVDEKLRALRAGVTAAEQAATANDSVALPVVALGVLLTAIPEELAGWAPWVYWPLMGVAVVGTLAAVRAAWKLHRARGRSA